MNICHCPPCKKFWCRPTLTNRDINEYAAKDDYKNLLKKIEEEDDDDINTKHIEWLKIWIDRPYI